jgi:hypothetical protein
MSRIVVDVGSIQNLRLREGIGTRVLGLVSIVPVCLSGVYSTMALSIQYASTCT